MSSGDPSDLASERLRHAIDALNSLRPSIGDAAVDAALEELRQKSTSEVAARAAGAAGAEQRLRQVSILFADIVDSTAMLGRLGPEDAMDLVGRVVEEMTQAVEHRGGRVLRLTGDGLKAAFGADGLREDEAERAVHAGLDILQRAARHAERVSRELGIERFGVRVGIHSGPVLLGGGLESDRTAMGHAVHLAARMEQSAPVGRLRVSAATWAQVRGLFHGEPQPPLLVKGHATPLATWLVTGEVAAAEPTVQRGVEGIDTPMIGRDAELDALRGLVARAHAGGRPGVALVVGEAGVGKTRLRQALLASLAVADDDARLLQVRAYPSSVLQPYGLVRRLLTRWFAIPDDLPAEAARQRLVDGMTALLGPDALAKAARVGQLIGFDFAAVAGVRGIEPAQLRRQAFRAVRDAVHARARRAPLVVVIDDLHWADDASLEFVTELCQPVEAPLAIVLFARPDLHERGFALETEAPTERLTLALGALDGAHGDALVEALLRPFEEPQPALHRLLVERAGGNPFFLEALVNMLIDEGVIDASRRPWRVNGQRLSAGAVPPTLLGVLQARLDALPADELLALQSASVIGPVFWDSALEAVAPATSHALAALQRRALVVPRETSRFAETAEVAFGHQLMHDTAYGTVLKPQRRAGHAAAARWLSARLTGRASEFLSVTAEHYERAGESAEALDYWERAAREAFSRFANDAALAFADRALAQPALQDARRRFDLMMLKHRVLDRLGRSDDDIAVCDALVDQADRCDDDVLRAEVAVARMLRADRDGRGEEARALAHHVLALARRSGSEKSAGSVAYALAEFGWLAYVAKDLAAAARHYEEALPYARQADAQRRVAGAASSQELMVRAAMAHVLIDQAAYVQALAAVEQGLSEIDAGFGSLRDRYNLLRPRASALEGLGRLDEALQTTRACVALAGEMEIPRMQAVSLTELAELAVGMRDLDLAASALDEAREPARASDRAFVLPETLRIEGLLAQARGDAGAAREALNEAIRLFAARDAPTLTTRCDLAALERAQGRPEAARAIVEEILADPTSEALPDRRAIEPEGLLTCFHVLREAGDPRASSLLDALAVRLDEQLAALADPADRETLIRHLPWWRETRALVAAR